MRLLLDINILLDVVCKRPGASASSALIASCGKTNDAWLAWHSVATLAYLIERQYSVGEARAFITDLLTWARVAATDHEDALRALDWPMPDFEDALQASAALACGAAYIITRNGRDFIGSPVPAMTPEDFLSFTSKIQ
ncbi:MAG: pilus assembly protein [Methylococcaceae bacterium]|nr:MAG: pilus assembly protein [Methylococcaceae bacterium]